MSIRKFLIATIIAAVATGALALSPEYTDWGKGPASYLMTKEEQSQWKAVRTDGEAKKFVDLFWARRDPSPATPDNEFKAMFDERVRYADERFTQQRKKGSMTDRGHIFVIIGAPTFIRRSDPSAQGTIQSPTAIPSGPTSDTTIQGFSPKQLWVYEQTKTKLNLGQPSAEIAFVDQYSSNEWTLERTTSVNISELMKRAVQSYVVSPNLTEVPKYGQAAAPVAAPAAPVAAPAAPVKAAVLTEFKTPAYKTAVTEFKAAKKSPYDRPMYVTWSEAVTGTGEYFVPVSVYVPKSAGLSAGSGVTFFGAVEDANGATVQVFEEPVTLTATKDDLYFDKSLTLPGGKLKGTFGLADATGKPITIVSTNLDLAGSLDNAAEGTSKLLLSNNIYAMTEAQTPTEPYGYGGLKVVPKGDQTFNQADDLWYFVEIRNPGIGDAQVPKIQTKIDVEGTDTTGKKIKMSAPPSEATATEFKGMPGHWGVGSAIPLATFKPGNYNISIKIMDTVNKTSYTVKNEFKVVPGAVPAAPPAQ